MSNPAMQTRCIHCGREQYAPDVYELSTKGGPCPWCGEMIGSMGEQDYAEKLRQLRQKEMHLITRKAPP